MSEEKNIPIEDEVKEEAKEAETEAEEEKAEETVTEETAAEEPAEEKTEEASEEKKEESEAEKQLAEMNAKYMRLMADFQNQKKRFEKEKADIYQFANEDIVKSLLEVIDNFERALDAAQGNMRNESANRPLVFRLPSRLLR